MRLQNSGGSEEFLCWSRQELNGVSYILVTDSEDDDAECLILKIHHGEGSADSLYEIVEDDEELAAVSKSV